LISDKNFLKKMESNRLDISIIVPLFNEAESLPELAAWIERVCRAEGLSHEVIFVDDGSTDGSWGVVEGLALADAAGGGVVRGIKFSRNYGKSAALYAGFEAAEGEVVITMDADLQDSPDEIPELRRMVVEEGYDLVSGWKKQRHDPVSKRLPSKFFNATTRLVSGIRLHDMNCGLKAYRRAVVKSIEVYGEMHRYIPILARQAGFTRIGEKVVEHRARRYGSSKYGIERMVKGYLDLVTVSFMARFGRHPMYLFGSLGTLMFVAGFVTAVWLIVEKLVKQARGLPLRIVADQPMFYVAIVTLVLGVMLFLTGFLGELVIRNAADRNKYSKDKTL
jgi:glycosyltransferase involved in cell wall biosynthesis